MGRENRGGNDGNSVAVSLGRKDCSFSVIEGKEKILGELRERTREERRRLAESVQ